jgi:hypothetical protein
MTPFVRKYAKIGKSSLHEELWVPAERIYALPAELTTSLNVTSEPCGSPGKEEQEDDRDGNVKEEEN